MNNNINRKLEEVLKKINPSDLKKLAASPAILQIIKSLNSKDREKLLHEFSHLSTDEIKRKLGSSNLSSFQGLSADEIIKRLKSL